jgi:hypothetical protein
MRPSKKRHIKMGMEKVDRDTRGMIIRTEKTLLQEDSPWLNG